MLSIFSFCFAKLNTSWHKTLPAHPKHNVHLVVCAKETEYSKRLSRNMICFAAKVLTQQQADSLSLGINQESSARRQGEQWPLSSVEHWALSLDHLLSKTARKGTLQCSQVLSGSRPLRFSLWLPHNPTELSKINSIREENADVHGL